MKIAFFPVARFLRFGLASLIVAFCMLLTSYAIEPDNKPERVADQSRDLLEKSDFAQLDELYAKVKKIPFDIREQWDAHEYFFRGLNTKKDGTPLEFETRKAKLEAWIAHSPDSLAPQIALGDAWIAHAWEARGTGWANTVTEEGWKKFHERLAEARKILESIPEEKIDDASVYSLLLVVAMGEGWKDWPEKKRDELFRKAIAIDKNRLGPYMNRRTTLSPKWGGARDDCFKLAERASAAFSPEDADWLYSYIAYESLRDRDLWWVREPTDWGAFYGKQINKTKNPLVRFMLRLAMNRAIERESQKPQTPPENAFEREFFDYDRVKRTFTREILQSPDDARRWLNIYFLAYCAAVANDQPTLRRCAFLSYEGLDPKHGVFTGQLMEEDREVIQKRLAACTAAAEIAAARALEKAGKLDEAEAAFRAFGIPDEENPNLAAFYMRQGMKEKFLDVSKFPLEDTDHSIAVQTEDIGRLTPAQRHPAAYYAMLFGEWERADLAAEFFDQARPWNISGKAIRLLLALRKNDPAAIEQALKAIAEYQTGRKPYQAAQLVASGEKTFDEVRELFSKEDDYTSQGALALMAVYLAKGDKEIARRVGEELLPLCYTTVWSYERVAVESLLYGRLSREF